MAFRYMEADMHNLIPALGEVNQYPSNFSVAELPGLGWMAGSLANLGSLLAQRGEYAKALEYNRKAVVIWEKTLGTDHPYMAGLLSNTGTAYHMRGEYHKALKCFGRSLAVWERMLGPEHPALTWALAGMGNVLVDQGSPQEALNPLSRAASICERKTCDPEPYGRGLFALARALVATHANQGQAIRLAKRARDVLGKVPRLSGRRLQEVEAWLRAQGVE